MTLPTPTADLLLLGAAGDEVAQYLNAPLDSASADDLTAAARRVSGRDLWLLHDGGLTLGQSRASARFEVLDEAATGSGPPAPVLPHARPWQLPGWRGEALAWMAERLGEPVAEVAWVHTSDVGAVLTARAGTWGRVYLKAGEDGTEARAAAQVSGRLPELVPDLLAADPQRGWLLSADAGDRLTDSAEPGDWLDAVQGLARLHQQGRWADLSVQHFAELPQRVADLLTPHGLHHWGLNPDQQEQIRALLPRFQNIHRAVVALGLPACACHGDAHPNNILVRGNRVRLFDFSEAATAHPLTDLGWLLAFVMLPARSDLGIRRALPELGERLWDAYRTATGLHTDLTWQDVALLALFHRAVVYDARFHDWTGTLPGFRPQYVPYYLKIARQFGPAHA